MTKKLSLQIAFWVIITGITFGVTSSILPLDKAIMVTLINFGGYLMAFYTNTLFLFPKYYQENNNLKYFSSVIALILTTSFLILKAETLLIEHNDGIARFSDNPEAMAFARIFFWLALMVAIGSIYLIQQKLQQHLLLNKEIQEDKLKTELKLLKSQINPHFLFNALNNIFSLAHMKSDKAPESILKLSSMLRYVIEDCVTETVSLKSEVEYLENYIAFQEMKSPDTMNVNFQYEQSDLSLRVAPMLFIPFLENSFKYSMIEEFQNAYINIEIKTQSNKKLVFHISNSIPPGSKARSGAGTGIKNVKQRLNILYPNKHTVEIEEKADSYSVALNIETHET